MERPSPNLDSKSPVCELLVQRLPHGHSIELPAQASRGSAGFDLRAAVNESVVLAPGERTLVPTGLVMAIPDGFEGQVRPRSGLALRHGVTVLNSPGTIDSDYRGEVGVILINHGQESFHIERGDRIAQLVVARAALLRVGESNTLTEIAEGNDRGTRGFGSTGRK